MAAPFHIIFRRNESERHFFRYFINTNFFTAA